MTNATAQNNSVKPSHHPALSEVEKTRPDFDNSESWTFTKAPNTKWQIGDGASSDEWKDHKKISVDPNAEGRFPVDNYKTLISAINPRPVGFVSTVSKEGVRNLAPFSFFNVVNTDPPIFVLGFATNAGVLKDTPANILETGELTINIISEWFVEAANFCSIDAPSESDEWELSGLTPLKSEDVAPPHVAESAFSIEAKLVSHHEWKAKADPSRTSGVTLIVEGVRFHIREDVANKDLNLIDVNKLKPVSRLGGISYGRTTTGYELSRAVYSQDVLGKGTN